MGAHLMQQCCDSFIRADIPGETLTIKKKEKTSLLWKKLSFLTRLSSDLEAVTMYKLKRQYSNMQTDQGFKYKELVHPAGLSSLSVQLVRPAGPSSWSVQLVCLAKFKCCKAHVLQSAKNKVSSNGNYILYFQFYPMHLMHCIWHIA